MTLLRYAIAAVWLVFGLGFKVFNLMPRHRRIVARVLGERFAAPITICVGLGEAGIGVWMASGRELVACVALQTLAIVSMNTLELIKARDLLLSAPFMLVANVVLLTAGWFVALHPG